MPRSAPRPTNRPLGILWPLVLIVALLAGAFSQGAAAAPAPAGLRIVNIAHVSYFHTGLGLRETVSSNRVEAVVQAVPALHVDGGADRRVPRGVASRQDFAMLNTGNTPLELRPLVRREGGEMPITGARLVWDRDADGEVDHNDPALANTPLTLAPGEEARLIYLFDISPRAPLGATAMLRLQPRPEMPEPFAAQSDIPVTGAAAGLLQVVSAELELRKRVARSLRPQGEILTYTLTLQNDGEVAVQAVERINGDRIEVDGAPRAGVLVRDPIPLNTVFEAPGQAAGLLALYHLAGSPAHSYVSVPPEAPEEIDAVAFLHEGPVAAGHSREMSFRVRVPHHVGGVAIVNTARVFVSDESDAWSVESNPVAVRREVEAGGLAYVDGGDAPVFRGTLDEDVQLLLSSGACNVSRAPDRIEVAVSSLRTGDVELIAAMETGANTGRFASAPLPVVRMQTAVAGDGVLAATQGDVLIATSRCGGLTYDAEILIDPGNFVFNSVNDAPVEGARVALLDSDGREIRVETTDAEGFFSFGQRAQGRYRYSVEAPGHAYPSIRRVFQGFARQVSSDMASWGGMFHHAAGPMMRGDVPVDPSYGIPIAVEKRADRDRVATGGHVIYTLELRNEMGEALVEARLRDTLPYGARIVPGTATLEGVPIADPTEAADGTQDFALGNIAPGTVLELRYAVRFGAAARPGENRNIARLAGRQAGTGIPLVSAAAQAVVQLDDRGGAFDRTATITGTVFLDCDADGSKDGAGEPGVPGVRLVTQAGRFAVTDINGQYSFRGLPAHAHAISPARDTLPEGAQVGRGRWGDARSGGIRVVAPGHGELRSEHFGLTGCTPALRAAVAERVAVFADRDARATLEVSDLPATRRGSDARAAVTEAGRATSSQIYRRDGGGTAAAPAAEAVSRSLRLPLGEAIRGLNSTAAFLDLQDGTRLDRRVVSLRVKGPADLQLSLRVGDREVPEARIGERTIWSEGNVQAIDYVAVELEAGQNVLTLSGTDTFGITRADLAITVHAPGDPAGLRLEAQDSAPATAGTAIPVVLQLTDRAGQPVMSSAVVSLRTTLGEWDATDVQPETPGLQVFVAAGRAELTLRAPQLPGRARLFARTVFGETEADIVFSPDLEARELVGVIEGTLPLGGGLVSPFEHGHAGLSGEVYLRGAVGDTLVTLHYDSRKEEQGLLDAGGDGGFPVFGDSSEQGFDARSSSGVYLRLDRAASSFVLGDIATAPELDGFRLGGGGRIVNGAEYALQTERAALTLFAARTGQTERVVELAGRGITGPYPVDLSGMIAGSDRAWRVVRDREDGAVLSEQPLERLTDYVLDYFDDTVHFDEPLAQADADGHPVSVRLVFETEGEVDRHWLYGGDLVWTPVEGLEVGARMQHTDAPRGTRARERLQAAYMRRQIDDGTRLELELARTENESGRTGMAGRVRFERERAAWRGAVEVSHADAGFAAAASPVQPDSSNLEASLERTLSPSAQIRAEVGLRRDYASGSTTADLRFSHEYDLTPRLTRRSEIRASRESDARSDDTTVWLGAGAVWRPATDRPLEFDLLLEQAVWGGEEGLLSFGAAHELTANWSVSGEAELGLALDGTVGDLRRLRLSSDYDVTPWLRGRTELSRSGGDAARGRLVQGLQADWRQGQWGFGLGVEHSEPVQGDGERLTSLSMSADWRSIEENWILETDVDRTLSSASAGLSTNVGLAGRISPDWTLLGRSRFSRETAQDGARQLRHRMRVGVAYRPVAEARLDMLGWYEHRLERAVMHEADHLWTLAGSWRAARNLQINGRYSGRLAELDLDAGGAALSRETVMTQLAQIGAHWDLFDDRVALGGRLMRIWDDQGDATAAGGVEIGLAVGEGAMLSLGHNIARREAAGMDALYEDGTYLRVRMSLDDRLWDRLSGFLDQR